jgi:4-hydroxyphenylpyruvate dioxygenase
MRQPDNPIGLLGVDHIHFYVDNADSWADVYVKQYGMAHRFVGDASTGLDGRKSVVVGRNRIQFCFTSAVAGESGGEEVAQHYAKHGNGVKDVAFLVVDAKAALDEAVRRGATPCCDLKEFTDVEGSWRRTAVKAYGDTIHSFIERFGNPPFSHQHKVSPIAKESGDPRIRFSMIDHIVANVESMNEWVDYYANIFGFKPIGYFNIDTGRSALMSKVMGSERGYIKLPINEPSSKNSQIQEYLDAYRGPGVQHIAFLCSDIVETISAMRERGVDFLGVPDTYYDMVPERVSQTLEVNGKLYQEIIDKLDDCKKRGILIDADRPDGYLLQLFTKPIYERPTLFHEIIQRRGNSTGFGEGNFRALFEAIEREQALRGTL